MRLGGRSVLSSRAARSLLSGREAAGHGEKRPEATFLDRGRSGSPGPPFQKCWVHAVFTVRVATADKHCSNAELAQQGISARAGGGGRQTAATRGPHFA